MQIVVRSPAIVWWKSLRQEQRDELIMNFYPQADPIKLTISQIEQIYKALNEATK